MRMRSNKEQRKKSRCRAKDQVEVHSICDIWATALRWCEQVLPKIEDWLFRGKQLLPCLAPQALNRQTLGHPLNRERASLDETMLGLSVFPQVQRIPPVRAV